MTPDGLHSWCKPCLLAYSKDRNARFGSAKWKQIKPPFTMDKYKEENSRTGGRCSICWNDAEKLDVDHCHTTGAYRGLICAACNHGLGNFRDDPDRLANAILYLQLSRVSR